MTVSEVINKAQYVGKWQGRSVVRIREH